MKFVNRFVLVLAGLLWSLGGMAQTISADSIAADTVVSDAVASHPNNQVDVIDIVRNIAHPGIGKRVDTGEIKAKPRISVVPAAGYSLQTSFAAIVAANAAFYTNPEANTSSIVTSFTYTAMSQIILPIQSNIYTKGNKYNIVFDWRYLYYPSYTYGLGGYTALNNGYLIDYSTLHLHQAVLRELKPDMYAGVGYNLDYFWNIHEQNPPGKVTDFELYGLQKTEFASGFTFNFLYDTRRNSINPDGGNFLNVIYRPNLVIFGNTATWRSLVIDARKYVHFPADSKNILAFWNYDWLTVSGKPPYLMLPYTGGDPYSNTGRGYIQGRFRGNNMLYLESEYRFGITNNGLIGGVAFVNAQSFTEQASGKFETVAPGWGAGLRLKFNKFSRTNVAIDYGFGLGHSGGVFVNVGEVF